MNEACLICCRSLMDGAGIACGAGSYVKRCEALNIIVDLRYAIDSIPLRVGLAHKGIVCQRCDGVEQRDASRLRPLRLRHREELQHLTVQGSKSLIDRIERLVNFRSKRPLLRGRFWQRT